MTEHAPKIGARTEEDAAYTRPATDVARAAGVDPAEGLSGTVAIERRERDGPNEIPEAPPIPTWRRFFRQFSDLVVWILIAAAIISGVIGDWADTAAILAIVLLNGILGFLQEERAERSLSALRELSAPLAHVFRGGILETVPARDLVGGDVIQIEAGDAVPADARLVEAYDLRVQEASLTGESVAESKAADAELAVDTALGDRVNMVYLGTVAAAGKARAIVTATGMETELGRIAGMLRRHEPEPTPLQIRLRQLGRVLVVVCLALVAVIFTLQVLRGGDIFEVFLLSVSLAVAAVPEGLPAVVTIALALGLRRMVERNALVRRLPSVETLGSVTVICSDKTGTLTKNEMTVREIRTPDSAFSVTGVGYAPSGKFLRRAEDSSSRSDEAGESEVTLGDAGDLARLLTVAARCNNASVHPTAGAKTWQVIGDPTEGALVVAALKARLEAAQVRRPTLFEIPFDSERRAMSVVVEEEPGRPVLYTKGAVEAVVARCTSEHRGGRIEPLDDERRRAILAEASEMASRSLRVLGFALRDVALERVREVEERDLTFVGLAGMIDPPREEVKRAVEECGTAGIRPIMITGDHPQTARAIASELRILREGDRVVTGAELDRLSDEELKDAVETIGVYARVSPEHKLRVVGAWRARGQVVAMTGDGVNDAPAVRSADIGVAMGITGTDVTKGASDMVLTDDNFASIIAAVEEGRGIFDNIQKFVHYLLACNAGEVAFMFLATLIGWPIPLVAIQILWINLVTDSLPALALAMEPPERDVMRRPPRPPKAPVIDGRRGRAMLAHGLLLGGTAAVGFGIIYGGDAANLPRARTAAFCVIAFSQLLFAVSCRSRTETLGELGWTSNLHLWGAIAISTLLQVGVIVIPVAQSVFEVSTLRAGEWGWVGALAFVPVTVIELGKTVVRVWFPSPDRTAPNRVPI